MRFTFYAHTHSSALRCPYTITQDAASKQTHRRRVVLKHRKPPGTQWGKL